MSVSALKTWIAGEVLTASDLNAEFSRVYSAGIALVSPLTSNLDLDGNTLVLDADGDSSLKVSTNNRFDLTLAGAIVWQVDGTVASIVNGMVLTGSATGVTVTLGARGSDTNISVTLSGKGTGAVILGQSTSTDVRLAADQPIADSSGNELVKWTKTASAVNEFTIANAATGAGPVLSATGGDTDIGVTLKPKGAGTTIIADGNGNEVLIAGAATASAVNEITVTNAATGSGASIAATGGDSNIPVVLTPKGTGTVTSNSAAIARGLIAGLTISNNGSDATNDIDIAAGVAAASTTWGLMALTSGLTKRLDAGWAVGTNAGMRATGAAIANGTYHIFLIRRPDTGVVDIAADTSATGANIATNTNAAYTQIRRIGSILRESGAIVAFTQLGDEFLRKASVLDVNSTNPGTSAVTRTLSVPTGLQVWARVRVNIFNSGSAGVASVVISELDRNDEAPAGSAAPLADAGNAATSSGNTQFQPNNLLVRTNTSGQVRSRLAFSDASVSLYMATFGWVDSRGRDD